MGLNSCSTADLAFEDTPAERLGEPGNGMRVALRTLDGGRIGIAAQAVGIAQAALESPTGYAKERNAFGGPIARLQAIQHKLADMQTEIEAARALVWRAARLKEAGRPHTVEGAQAKLFASARRPPPDRRGDPDPRRLRLHQGVPGRALLPRRQGHRDLRGHERDPAPRHRPCTARRSHAGIAAKIRVDERGPVHPRPRWPHRVAVGQAAGRDRPQVVGLERGVSVRCFQVSPPSGVSPDLDVMSRPARHDPQRYDDVRVFVIERRRRPPRRASAAISRTR